MSPARYDHTLDWRRQGEMLPCTARGCDLLQINTILYMERHDDKMSK
jgi:hypothetical protein